MRKYFLGSPGGLQGATRVAKVMGSIFFQNIHFMSSILVVFLQNMNSIVNVLDFLVQYCEARLPYTQQHQLRAIGQGQ